MSDRVELLEHCITSPHMVSARNGLIGILAAAVLAGCAQSPSKPTSATDVQPTMLAPIVSAKESVPAGEGSFEPSTLYSLLVAELAGQQGLPEVTLHHYLQEAIKTKDLGIIKRTVEIADYLNDDISLLKATLLWVKAEPDEPAPFSIASEELIRQGRFEEAKPLLRRTLELGGLAGLDVINTLTHHAEKMKSKDRQAYLALFDDLLKTSPNKAHYLYAKASLLGHEGQYKEALVASQQALQSNPRYIRAIILVADLQDRLGHLDAAITYLQKHLVEIDRKQYRNHKEFRLLYTRLLMKQNRFAEAEAQAEIVALKNRHDENILYYLGALMLDYEQLDSSERYFALLPDLTGYTGKLRYYLGRIAQRRGNRQQALDYFSHVDDPRYLVVSFNAIGNILNQATDQSQLSTIFSDVRSQHPNYAPLLYGIESHWLVKQALNNTALTLLNGALVRYPDDVRLLHNRAMLWEKLDDLLKMEIDLRKLLQLQPSNAITLNTFSYTLTDQTQSQSEKDLIRPALQTKPEDPAILENMGWVLHNLGDLEGALHYLKKAYEIFPEPEIAAHLGTVYWKLGQTHLALEVWDNSLKAHPNRNFLNKFLSIVGDDY